MIFSGHYVHRAPLLVRVIEHDQAAAKAPVLQVTCTQNTRVPLSGTGRLPARPGSSGRSAAGHRRPGRDDPGQYGGLLRRAGGGLLERRCICLFAKDARTSNVPMVVVAGAMRAQAVPQGFSDARVFRRGP